MSISAEALRQGMELCQIPAHRRGRIEEALTNHAEIVSECLGRFQKAFEHYDRELFRFPEGLEEQTLASVITAVYCLMTPLARESYLRKGYREEDWRVNIPDINWHTNDGPKGEFWLTSKDFAWQFGILDARVIKVGRLQYNPRACEEDYPGLGLRVGDPLINIHIPACGALDPQECRKSIQMADEYLVPKFGECKAFFCQSWFLNPMFRKYLPQNSNIIQFQNLGILIPVNISREDVVLDRVFRYFHEDPFTPTPRTSLQKAVQTMMLKKEPLSAGQLIILRKIEK